LFAGRGRGGRVIEKGAWQGEENGRKKKARPGRRMTEDLCSGI